MSGVTECWSTPTYYYLSSLSSHELNPNCVSNLDEM